MFTRDQPPPGPYIVLSGRISLRSGRGASIRIVNEMDTGAIGGRLPYSRMPRRPGDPAARAAPGLSVAEEPVEILLIPDTDIREMVAACHEFTALCVHQMVDRTRWFKSDDLQREKMASLGRLSAGLAHELNNPSSAVARSAKELNACRIEVSAASRELGAAGLTDVQLAVVAALETAAEQGPLEADSPLALADREDALGQWCENHGLGLGPVEPLAGTTVGVSDLDAVRAALSPQQLKVALRYVAANVRAERLTREIEDAATRIHTLVDAVKKHTHMDRAPVVEAIPLGSALSDTMTLVRAKASAKAVTLDLTVEPDLPAVQGVVGELNQVWLNLVDNAIDAVPENGCVSVTARRERDAVVVSVIDDGAGVSEDDRGRIFDPFFTTKPVGQGTGLGLDVVQAVVRSHGGSVQMNSRPGRTEFRVSLPAWSS